MIQHSTQISIVTIVGEDGVPLEHVNEVHHFDTIEEWEEYTNRLDVWMGIRPRPKEPVAPRTYRKYDPEDRLAEILDFASDDHKFVPARSTPFDQTAE